MPADWTKIVIVSISRKGEKKCNVKIKDEYHFYAQSIRYKVQLLIIRQFRRLGLTGHVKRMEGERITKKVLNGRFHRIRTVRRPRIRWAKWSRGSITAAGNKRMEQKS